ncbi:MAG: hypothetical protein PF503_22795 [Desulfobacula sp.]|jgi:hypothetical protein|nr:hypothetical protein [Desulfobacula sp.]
MILFIPIFLSNDSLNWEEPPLCERVKRIFKETAHVRGISCCVVATNSFKIANLARDYSNIDIVIQDSIGELKKNPLLDALLGGCIQTDKPVLVVNFRNITLDADVINNAISQFVAIPDIPLFSVCVSENNPSQLRMHYNVSETGLIHLFDTPKEVGRFQDITGLALSAVSRSFLFPWEIAPGFKKDCSIYESTTGGNLLPLGIKHNCSSTVCWFREDNRTARILWIGEKISKKIIGMVSESAGAEPMPTYLYAGKKGNVLLIARQISGVLQIAPITSSGIVSRHGVSFPIENGTVEFRIPIKKTKGFVYSIEENCIDGQFSSERHFDPDGILWNADTQSLKSGVRITGRQHFPPIFEKDLSLYIGTRSQAAQDSVCNGSEFLGFFLKKGQSSIILTKLDMLRALANEQIFQNKSRYR